MANKRNLDRQRRRFQVHYGIPADISRTGFTQDVSRHGMFIQAAIIHPPKTLLEISLDNQGGEPIRFSARVVWSKKVPPSMVRKIRCGMGVAIEAFQSGEEHYQSLLRERS